MAVAHEEGALLLEDANRRAGACRGDRAGSTRRAAPRRDSGLAIDVHANARDS
ncbi:MAG: hypothetical protein LBD25_08435 [Coriobacteriales bacterium]|nr:hypothetical protein [Coriobacteriales bacterium]